MRLFLSIAAITLALAGQAQAQTAAPSAVQAVDVCAQGMELFQGALQGPPSEELTYTLNHSAQVTGATAGTIDDRQVAMVARMIPTVDPANPTKVTSLSVSIDSCTQQADDYCDYATVAMRASHLDPWTVQFCGFAAARP